MNKRIKELAEQAGFQYIKDEGIGWAGNYNDSLPKFAELIVKECAEVADNADATREKWQSIGKFVKEHFGVEE